MAGPLDGLKVLDVTQMIAGSLCCTILGDLGADVIKVEPPTGDSLRRTGETMVGNSGESDGHMSVNRNKRSVVADLKTAEGRDFAIQLALRSDVLVENYKPGTMKRLGLGYEELSKHNPGLIYCSVSGFGQTGPHRNRPAMDQIIQAWSGLMQLTGDESTGPLRTGFPYVDLLAPAHAATGVLAALHERDRTGLGQYLEISMLNTGVFGMMPRDGYYFATGKSPVRTGNRHHQVAPCNIYKTSDGRDLMIMTHTDKHWLILADALADPRVTGNPKFTGKAGRHQHRAELDEALAAIFSASPMAHWEQLLGDAEALYSPVRTLDDVFSDPQIRAEMVVEVPHPTAGKMTVLANPLHFSRTPASIRRPPPLLGEHDEEVRNELREAQAPR